MPNSDSRTQLSPPDQALAGIIESCQAKSVVALGGRGQRLAQLWCRKHEACALSCLDSADLKNGLNLPQTPELALVTDTLEHLSRPQGQILLGQLRNYGASQIAVLVSDKSDWTLTDFIGLGFRRQARLSEADTSLTLYTYNLASYNHKRDWNNPRFWANPEMWGKARW